MALTVHHIWILAFTSNKPDIKFVRAFLLHLDDYDIAAPASRLDWHNAAIHDDAVFTRLQG